MTGSHDDHHRLIVLRGARRLIDGARTERALLPGSSPERQFYLGVEAAAEEVLHPELGESRGPDWLALKVAAFRDGYLQTSTLLSAAKSAAEPPLSVRMPEPTPVR